MEPNRNDFHRPLLIFLLVYVVTHAVGLTRELSYEEGIFIQPGLNLLQGHGFSWSWGELLPDGNAFHKPPLLSLLAGLLAYVTHTVDFGPKLIPFLAGLFCVLLPRLFTRGGIVSILLLVSPFFLAASSHVQTDSTVGLVGYGLVCFGGASILREQALRKATLAAVGAGTLILWLGKVEIAVFASLILCPAILLSPRTIRFRFAAWSAGAAGAGLLGLLGSCYLLGRTAHLGWDESAIEVIRTIVRITTDTAERNLSSPSTGLRSSRLLFSFLGNYGAIYLFILLTVPVWLAVAQRGWWHRHHRVALFLLGSTAIPALAYLGVGYTGDGFPRYFLIVFLPLALLSATALSELPDNRRRIASAGMLLGAFLFLAPSALNMQLSPRSPTGPNGDFGHKEAAQTLSRFTSPHDLLAVPEPCALYLRERRTLQLESFEPYVSRHPLVLARLNEIQALIVPGSALGPQAESVSKKIAATLRNGPHFETTCGSLVVIVRRETARE